MSKERYETDGVPERLRPTTVETLPVEELYVIAVDPYIGLQDVVYIDKTQANGRGRLVVDGRQPVESFEVADLSKDGAIILMKVWLSTSDGDVIEGVVADCRRYSGELDVVDGMREVDFTDQEEAWEALDDQQHQVVISAVIDNDDDGKVKVWGDSAFYDAAMYMANAVDGGYVDSSAVKPVKSKNKSKNKKTKKSKKSKN